MVRPLPLTFCLISRLIFSKGLQRRAREVDGVQTEGLALELGAHRLAQLHRVLPEELLVLGGVGARHSVLGRVARLEQLLARGLRLLDRRVCRHRLRVLKGHRGRRRWRPVHLALFDPLLAGGQQRVVLVALCLRLALGLLVLEPPLDLVREA